MDPVSIIATALVLGAANGLKEVAEVAIKDCYTAIKSIIQSDYSSVDVEVIEKNPESEVRQAVLEEDLSQAKAGEDEQLLEKAQELISLANSKMAQETISSVGVEIIEVEGGNLEIRRVNSETRGVVVKKSKFSGDITVTDVHATSNYSESEKKKLP